MSKKNFDIYDYVHNNKFKLTVEQKASKTFKGYNDIRKTNINEVVVNENGLDLKASLQENRMLAPELKKHFLEIISTYNGFREQMQRQSDIVQVAETLGGVVEAAKELTINEADDWFDKVTIKRNMRELEKLDSQFTKVVSEAKSLDQRLHALYEDMGHILGRYYEISDIDPATMKSRLGLKED